MIDFSGLDKIRQDAEATRDSLLTEEERAEEAAPEARTACAEEPEELFLPESLPEDGDERKEGILSGEEGFRGRVYEYLTDEKLVQVLQYLLSGTDPTGYLAENHLMPTVAADAVNEALFDLVGDNVLECEDGRLILVEDYREDLTELFEE